MVLGIAGVVCGAPLRAAFAQAEIHGTKFNDKNGNGLQDADELGIPNVLICLDGENPGQVTCPQNEPNCGTDVAFRESETAGDGEPTTDGCTFTDADGAYRFFPLDPGMHTVHEILPDFSVNTTPLSALVDLATGDVATVDFGNQPAMPPAPEISIEGGSGFEIQGLPVVHFGNPFTIRKDVSGHCAGRSVVGVKLVLGPFSDSGDRREMLMTQESGSIWAASFPPLMPSHGKAELVFYVDCSPDTAGYPEDITLAASEDEVQHGGNIYVDPSGRIVSSCDMSPIEGATVTILKLNTATGIFEVAPPSSPPLLPAVNPQTTDATGAYGWLVTPGVYRVQATKTGWSMQTTADLPVPPEQTDVNLELTPDAGCPLRPDPMALTLAPATATRLVDSEHCVDAKVTGEQGIPSPSEPVDFTVSGADQLQETVATNASGIAHFCYDVSALPGVDRITAKARRGTQPSATARVVITTPPSTTGCQLAYSGTVSDSNGRPARVRGDARASRRDIRGVQTYRELGGRRRLSIDSIDTQALICERGRAEIFGIARVSGRRQVQFRIDLEQGTRRAPDRYRLRTSDGFDSLEQVLRFGNAQIRR